MTYSPKEDNLKPLFITIIFTILSVLCFMFSGRFTSIKWLIQLCFICFATIAIQILLKYVLTRFEYRCDGISLSVVKCVGKRSLLIAKMELINSASYIARETDFIKSGEEYNVKSTYVYTRNLMTKNVYVYVTTIGETNYMIKLEANDEFAQFVNQKIDENLKGAGKYD